jgi:hypothetical protein
MADIAQLGIEVRASGIDPAAKGLDKLAGAAKRAENAVETLPGPMRAAAAAADAMGAGAQSGAAGMENAGNAAQRAGRSLKAANNNMKGANVGNLAAQFQDIAVSAQMAQSPLQIALQQGTQISAVFGHMGAAEAVKTLGTAFLSVLSPVALITIALVGTVAALIQAVNWAQLMANGLNALAGSLQAIAPIAAIAGAALAVAFGPQIVATVWALSKALLSGLVGALRAVAIAAAANPFVAIVLAIAAVVTAAYLFRDEMTRILGFDIVDAAKQGANLVIGSFVAAWEDIKFLWNQGPQVIGSATIAIGNAVLASLEGMINGATGLLNGFIDKVNGALQKLPGIQGETIGRVGATSVPRLDDPFAASNAAAIADRNAAVDSALNQDYIGAIGTGLSNAASGAAEKMRSLATSILEASDAKKKGKTEAEKLAEKYADLKLSAEQFITDQYAEQQALGMTTQAANALRYQQELLNKAQRDGIILTGEQTFELLELGNRMAAAEAATERLKQTQEAFNNAGRGFGDVLSGLISGTMSWKDALLQLIPIVLNLLNNLNKAGGGSGLFGSGFIGGLLEGLLGMSGGGYTGAGGTYQPKGIVHGGEYVFSKAATNRIGVGNLDAMHRGARGYAGGGRVTGAPIRSSANSNNAPAVNDNRTYKIDARGAQRGVAEEIVAAIDAYDKGRLGRLANDIPRLRQRTGMV